MAVKRVLLIAAWVLSLVGAAQWGALAQSQAPQLPGVEVRLIPAEGRPGAPHGTLVGYFNGQWLPVTVDTMRQPDSNSILR